LGQGTYRFLLRMPEELRRRVVDAAHDADRSINAEIVHRLTESFEPGEARRRGLFTKGERGTSVTRNRVGAAAALIVLMAIVAIAVGRSGGPNTVRSPAPADKRYGDPDSARFGPGSAEEAGREGPAAANEAEWQFYQRSVPTGQTPLDVSNDARAAWNAVATSFAKQPKKNNGSNADGVWQSIGPDMRASRRS
jgi:Arc-like DNA binding domain